MSNSVSSPLTPASIRTHGSSPTVIFCGGFKSNMQGSKAQALEAFCKSKSWGYCRFDYQGHGESPGLFEQGNISQWLRDTLTIIDSINDDKLILVGSSMGAWIAQLASIQRPQRVTGLLLLASATDFTRDLIESHFTEEQRLNLKNNGRVFIPSEYDDGSPYPITEQLLADGHRHLLLEKPIPITCPVRLIHGTADTDVPWQTSMRIVEKTQSNDVQMLLLKDADHRLSSPENIATIESTLTSLHADIEKSLGGISGLR